MAYRNYSIQNGFIVDKHGNGDFTTIGAAVTAASSGQTVYINDGTYTENFNGKAGVAITASMGDSNEPNVSIIGKISYSSAGVFTISNVQLQTNSDFFLAVTGSAASVVYINNCLLNCLNNTGISFTAASTSAVITITNCIGNLATTGITLFAQTSTGVFAGYLCEINNSGNSTTASTISAGILDFQESTLAFPITSSGTSSVTLQFTNINTNSTNTTSLTVGGSSGNQISYSQFISGSASCISIATGITLTMLGENIVNSTNTNAITGLGILDYTPVDFSNTGAVVNTSTQNRMLIGPQIWTGGITFDNSHVLNAIPVPVTEGGSGLATTTAYGLITGGTTATGNFQNAGTGAATSTVLIGNGSSALPSFSATPQLTGLGIGAASTGTGLTFDGVNTMSAYSTGTFTPTLAGATTAGTSTYSIQNGFYVKVGRMVIVTIVLVGSAATGTGNVQIGALPFTVANGTNENWLGSIIIGSAQTWPVGTSSPVCQALNNTANMQIYSSGTASGGGYLQMANVAFNYQCTCVYRSLT